MPPHTRPALGTLHATSPTTAATRNTNARVIRSSSLEPPGTHARRGDAEHHPIGRHGPTIPQPLEPSILRVKPIDQRTALWPVSQELGPADHGHALDFAAFGDGFGHDPPARVAPELARF